VVESVVGQFDRILLVCLRPPQAVVPVAMHQHGVHHGNVKEVGNRQMVVPCGLYHDTGFAIQLPQPSEQLTQLSISDPTSKGGITISPKGKSMTAIMLLPLETSMPTQFTFIPQYKICNRNPSFSRFRFNLLGDTNSRVCFKTVKVSREGYRQD
jgi:hypothetical protein